MKTTAEIRALEENAAFLGVSRTQLMENAGKAAFEEIRKDSDLRGKKIVVFCGPGNNGGDGFVLARHLGDAAADVKVLFLGHVNGLKEEAVQAYWKLSPSVFLKPQELHHIHQADFLVDALLGIGCSGELREPIRTAVRVFNQAKGHKIALDVPTGLDADTGKTAKGGEYVQADEIYTFHDLKPGLLKGRFGRKVKVLDIGIPEEAEKIIGPGEVLKCAKKRGADSHKGQNGIALIVGGCSDYVGSPALAAQAALACFRTGMDLVTVAAPEKVAWVINSFSPDLITKKLRGDHLTENHLKEVLACAERADAVLMGPGLGLHKETIAFVRKALHNAKLLKKPLVLDADALKATKGLRFKGRVLITPHAREFEIFTGKKLPSDLGKRIKVVEAAARKHHCVILLKGRVDIVSDGTRTRLDKQADPGLTTGGTGDVLAGLCLGLAAAKNNNLFDVACAAAFLTGKAGSLLHAVRGYTYTASDLLLVLPKLLNKWGFK